MTLNPVYFLFLSPLMESIDRGLLYCTVRNRFCCLHVECGCCSQPIISVLKHLSTINLSMYQLLSISMDGISLKKQME